MLVTQISKVHGPAENLSSSTTPILVQGGCRQWPAVEKWTKEWFKEMHGEKVVPLTDNVNAPHQLPIDKTKATLGQYLDNLKSEATRLYIAGLPYKQYFPDLNEDVRTLEAFSDNILEEYASLLRINHSTLFIGNSWVDSPTHTDSHFMATALSVVQGQKRIRLIEPNTLHDKQIIRNGIDIFSLEVSKNFPEDLTIYEGTISKGDYVYIPPGWWHHVKNDDDYTVAISNNFVGPCQIRAFEQSIRLMLWEKITAINAVKYSLLKDADSAELRQAQSRYLEKGRYHEFENEYIGMLVREFV